MHPFGRRSRPLVRFSTLQRVLHDPERKALWQIVYEASRFGVLKGVVPRQYFQSRLYHRRIREVSGYMANQEHWRLRSLVERTGL